MSDLQAAIERVRVLTGTFDESEAFYRQHAARDEFCEGQADKAKTAAADLRAIVGALEEAREVAGPFAEAADSLDDGAREHDHCWESAAAMSVTAGDFRAAQAFLAKLGDRP